MKVYQERWLDSLTEAYDAEDLEDYCSRIESVCEDILDDDTGVTDALTMEMADILRKMSYRLGKGSTR
jgi:hypothetical protein